MNSGFLILGVLGVVLIVVGRTLTSRLQTTSPEAAPTRIKRAQPDSNQASQQWEADRIKHRRIYAEQYAKEIRAELPMLDFDDLSREPRPLRFEIPADSNAGALLVLSYAENVPADLRVDILAALAVRQSEEAKLFAAQHPQVPAWVLDKLSEGFFAENLRCNHCKPSGCKCDAAEAYSVVGAV